MNFHVSAQHLAHVFPKLTLNHELIVRQLNLDLGHLQLLRDAYQQWITEQKDDAFWLLLLALVDAINQGSLCLDLGQPSVQQQLQKLGLNNSIKKAQSTDWQALTINQQNIITYDNGCLYFCKYHQLECQLQTALERLLAQYSGLQFTVNQIAQAAKQVTDELDFSTIENKQVLAIVISLMQSFSIISGGPGTGKTTIMSSVLRALMLLGYYPGDVVLAAPTGRAANRMTESLHDVLNNHITNTVKTDEDLLQIEAKTIHRLLGARAERGGFQFGAHNQLNCKVLVVDEVSMVDVALMRRLLQAIPSDCRVVFLGDQFQLPSVESGAVLTDLMPPSTSINHYSQAMWQKLNTVLTDFPCKTRLMASLDTVDKGMLLTDHVTVLDVSKRYQADIALLSELVRKGDSQAVFNTPQLQVIENVGGWSDNNQKGVYFIPAYEDNSLWQNGYLQWVKSHYFGLNSSFKNCLNDLFLFDENQISHYQYQLDQVFAVINSNRILTLVNDSAVGCLQMNAQITEMMKQQLAVSGVENWFHGSVIMIGQNNASLGLFNGDVAILLASSNGQLRAVIPYKNSYRSHSVHVMPRFTSAYAITVHKSQGSEFKHVLMTLPADENHRLLMREIIYTGMTRAKLSVGIYAHKPTMNAAINRQTLRHSGLRFWYNN